MHILEGSGELTKVCPRNLVVCSRPFPGQGADVIVANKEYVTIVEQIDRLAAGLPDVGGEEFEEAAGGVVSGIGDDRRDGEQIALTITNRSSCVSGGYNPEFAATLFTESTYMR